MTPQLRLIIGVLRGTLGMMARGDRLPKIGELEMATLQHLWHVQEDDVSGTHKEVGIARGITSNTVGSALERLHRKGLVVREKRSHAYRYRAAMSQDEFAAKRIVDVAGDTKSLAEAGLLAAFVDLVGDEDEESLDRLAALIAQKRTRKNRGDQ